MKILHVVTGLTRANGVSVFVCELAFEQVEQGHEVSILVKDVGVDVYPVDSRVKVLTPGMLSEFSRGAFSVVHIHALWDPWLTKISKIAKRAGIKIIWSPHGMLTSWALKHKCLKKMLGLAIYQYWSLRRADLLHVTAKSEMKDVCRLGLRNPIVIAPLGVRIAADRSLPLDASSGREHLVLFISRIQKKKGLSNLVTAWSRLPITVRNGWRVVIAGPDQENHTAELMAQCRRLGISEEVQFVGPVYGEEKSALYRKADLFVLPTYSENFGSVVVEALAESTPVICTKGAPWQELLGRYAIATEGGTDLSSSGRCGWWIDIGVEPLVEALKEAMSLDGHIRYEMGKNGRQLVETQYAWPAVAAILEKAYAE